MTSITRPIHKIEPNSLTDQYHALALQILQTDIEEMEYHWNENPMCDFYSKNAICTAMERLIRRNLGPTRLIADELTTSIRIGDTIHPMSQQVSNWFQSASRGLCVKPLSSIIWLPKKMVSRRLLKSVLSNSPRLIY